ncbi:MAG: response regulator transcription factor [Saprospiraceae bacterium]|nr:response regulator transcription factor [Saprospiraceae bacterium]
MSKAKILYVEDEPFLAKIVMETLQGRDFEVVHVESGNHALSAFMKEEPDLCVLDVMLPGKDGFTLGSEIRKIKPNLPIIFLTARDQVEDVTKGFSSGGNDYIRKPFSMEELLVRIDNLLSMTGAIERREKSDPISFGMLELDSVGMLLRTPQGDVQLSHRENEILKMLFTSPDGQIERKEILLQIWGDDSFFNSRNLDVYIRKIRKHLSADPGIQLITLKGVGYRLVHGD